LVKNATMKLGMLGTDVRIAAMAAEATRRGAQVVAAVDVAPGTWPQAVSADGGSLLDPAVCDVVFVGDDGWSEPRAELVRLLIQAGRPLLASHPLELSMLWAWEMEMIRRDAGGVLMPLCPERLHPFISRLKTLLEASLAGSGPLGVVESLLLERRLAARRGRADVLAAVARDADLIRVLTGDPARLSAIGVSPESPSPAWHALVVGFNGPTSVPVRWQAASGGEPGLRISLQGDSGVAVVEVPADWSRPWTWSEPGQADRQQAFDAPALILDRFEAAVAAKGRGDEGAPPAGDGLVPPATWADAARAIELADAVPRSLGKGRAVDLHQEEFSDLGTFRGTMASLGCGIILAALVLVVLATLVGGVAHEFGWGFGGWLAGTWPFVALAALGGFLVLQLLPLLVAGGGRHE
jgi:predicted dehydrogenase